MALVIDTTRERAEGRLRHPEKAHRPDTPVLRKPEWLRVRAPGSGQYAATREIVKREGLHTVCEEAACPNIGECWSQRHATLMIMGDTCTRACAFCNVATGKPGALNPHEPANIAEAVGKLGLGHVVVTSVDRRDDGREMRGAAVRQVVAIHRRDDYVPQPELGHRVGHPRGLARVQRRRHAGRDVAEGARPSTRLAHDHHGGVALRPALADVGAGRLLAHGREIEAAHQLSGLGVLR